MSNAKPDGNSSEEEREGGMLPAVLAGAGILAVFGFLLLGGGEDNDDKKQADNSAAVEKGKKKKPGGVAARKTDDASTGKAKLNPQVAKALAGSRSIGPGTPPLNPETEHFDSPEDEVRYWKKKLGVARQTLEMRERAADRMARMDEEIKAGQKEPPHGHERWEESKQVVEANLDRQRRKIAEIEEKLEALHM